MRRYLVFFLLFFLPLQFSWALAAGYCAHEHDQNPAHFGHHLHQHSSSATETPQGKLPGAADVDCSVCHAGTLLTLPSAPLPLLAQPGWLLIEPDFAALPLPPPERLDRPDWQSLA